MRSILPILPWLLLGAAAGRALAAEPSPRESMLEAARAEAAVRSPARREA